MKPIRCGRVCRYLRYSLICTLLFCSTAAAVQSPPLATQIKTPVGDVKSGKQLTVPLITWGGDMATILANGNSARTADDSIFAKKGLSLNLVRQDVFKNQVESYLKGDSPFLRGTMGMINLAADVLNRDPRTKPVIVYQLTWSSGGDCLVVKEGIRSARDLKGKTVALQAYGPHVDYLAKILKDAGLSMNDINIRWTKDLSGTADTPAEAIFNKDVDAAFVIIPDGLMLTSNGTVGTGAEGSVKGARIMISTKTANRIIADVYAVRSDFFQSHQDQVQAFVHGLLLGTQELKSFFSNKQKNLAGYQALLSASASILLDSPQATADAEALYGDCEFVGFRGNVRFFGDEKWPRGWRIWWMKSSHRLSLSGCLAKDPPWIRPGGIMMPCGPGCRVSMMWRHRASSRLPWPRWWPVNRPWERWGRESCLAWKSISSPTRMTSPRIFMRMGSSVSSIWHRPMVGP